MSMSVAPGDGAVRHRGFLAGAFPRRTLTAVGVLVVANAAVMTAGAYQLGVLVGDASWSAVAVLAALLAGREATWLLMRQIWYPATQRAGATWRTQLLARALGQRVHLIVESSAGELVDRIDDDTAKLVETLRQPGVMLVSSVLTAAMAAVVAGLTDPWTLVGFLTTGLLAVALCIKLTPPAASAQEELEAAWTDVTVVIEESVAARDDLRAAGGRAHALGRYSSSVSQLLAVARRATTRLNRLQAAVSVAIVSVAVGTTVLVTVAAAAGDLQVPAAVSVAALAAAFSMQVANAANNYPRLLEGVGALRRVLALSAVEIEPGGEALVEVPDGSVELRNVTFTYPHATHPSVDGVTLHLDAGTSVGLVGRSGAGKTTLVALLTRQVDTPAGCVFLGGVDVCDIPLEQLRALVHVVSQRTELVAGSVFDNVALFAPVGDEAVAAAFDELGLSDWVASLPEGLDTEIGPGGLELSSGEAQLVAFARLMVRDPLVVVLDEATARMDPLTESRVTRAASRLLHRRTGVLVAHRINTLRSCEFLAVLDAGRLVQYGTRAELARSPGPFAELVTASGLDADWVARDDGETEPSASPARRRQVSATGELTAAPLKESWTPRPWRTVVDAYRVDTAHGISSVVLFGVAQLLSFGGVAAATAWGHTVGLLEDGSAPWVPLGLYASSSLVGLCALVVARWRYPLWWTRLACHLRGNILSGQINDRRVRPRPAGEVVARALTADRVLWFADESGDLAIVALCSVLPAAVVIDPLVGTVLAAVLSVPFCVSVLTRHRTARLAVALADARSRSSVLLASVVDAARTVKTFGAAGDAVSHYEAVDSVRTDAAVADDRHRTVLDAVAAVSVGLGVVSVWALRAGGVLDTVSAVSASITIASVGYAAWLAQDIVSTHAGARVWLERATPLAQSADLVTLPAGMDFDAVPVPGRPPVAVRLERFEVEDLTVVHDDGLVAVEGCSFHARPGEVVLVIGEVGSGKSSLLAGLAGLRSYTGSVRWNGIDVEDPEVFLRPGQVAYVAQQPKVLSGTFVDNVALGHDVDVAESVHAASLSPDVARAGGIDTVVGHRGMRLSGGQVQRLALARALAAGTELVVADDVSSALDATTEVEVWQALRERGCAVVASSCKLAAVRAADRVVVLEGGRQVEVGAWEELSGRWGRLVS